MEKGRKFILGSNYWPREKAMYWWGEFDLSPARRDFSLMAEYGLELIRVFLLWEDFQPEINRISVRALDDLVRVADLANDRRIKILPTFFCGHMCGVNWLPSWILEVGKGEGSALPPPRGPGERPDRGGVLGSSRYPPFRWVGQVLRP